MSGLPDELMQAKTPVKLARLHRDGTLTRARFRLPGIIGYEPVFAGPALAEKWLKSKDDYEPAGYVIVPAWLEVPES